MAGILSALLGAGAAGPSRGILSDPLQLNNIISQAQQQASYAPRPGSGQPPNWDYRKGWEFNPQMSATGNPDMMEGPSPNAARLDGAGGILSGVPTSDTVSAQMPDLQTNAPNFPQMDTDKANRKKAMRQFGIAMLSGDGFFDGLAKGLQAYDDYEQSVKTGKAQLVNGGTHIMRVFPDGHTTFEQTPVADYGIEKAQIAGNVRQKIADQTLEFKKTDADRQYNLDVRRLTLDSQYRNAEIALRQQDLAAKIAENEQKRVDAGGKPMPAGIRNQATELSAKVAGAQVNIPAIQKVIADLRSGALDLSFTNKVAWIARNKAGGSMANDESRAYANLQSLLTTAQDSIMSAYTGVQARDDAKRAMDVINPMETVDSDAAADALERMLERYKGATYTQQDQLDQIYADYPRSGAVNARNNNRRKADPLGIR